MKVTTSFIQQLLIKALLPAIMVFVGACSVSAQRTTAVAKGEWGATGVAMNVTEGGASIEFDCADANIAEQLRVNKDGSFVVKGTFMRSGPGPVRADDEGRPVTFKGKVEGKSMTFQIADAKTGEKIGNYTVTQGQTGRNHRCY